MLTVMGFMETDLVMNAYDEKNQTAANWRLTKRHYRISAIQIGLSLSDALYNMSIEEMIKSC